MRRVYIRERSAYTPSELADKLKPEDGGFRHWDADECIAKLLKRGVLSAGSIIDDEDSSTVKYDKYQFRWVGLAVYQDLVIVVYPKYFRGKDLPTLPQMARILRVIRKAEPKGAQIGMLADDNDRARDPLALLTALFDMYAEYGEYTNYERTIESNGTGSISWERTIEQCQPFLGDDGPIYFDLKTIETNRNDSDYVTRLHRALLTTYSQELRESGLAGLLSIAPVELSDEELDDFGDPDIIDYRLERELNVQFITWKRDLISLLRSIVMDRESGHDWNNVACLGTASYQHVWELMCKTAFGDQLGISIDRLGMRLTDAWAKRGKETLLDIIPCPQWYSTEENSSETVCGPVKTLIPDVVSVLKHDDDLCLCIYDAKYYTPTLGKKVTGAPGVESITKQLLYQEAYKSFVKDQGVSRVLNTFFVPTSRQGGPYHLGKVDFLGIFPCQDAPFTNNIDVWALDADALGELYLDNEQVGSAVVDAIISKSAPVVFAQAQTLF